MGQASIGAPKPATFTSSKRTYSKRAWQWAELGLFYGVLTILAVVFVMPFLWMVSTSLKHNAYV
jgi:ABC-type glycerol-3-phosphate transport system permease component